MHVTLQRSLTVSFFLIAIGNCLPSLYRIRSRRDNSYGDEAVSPSYSSDAAVEAPSEETAPAVVQQTYTGGDNPSAAVEASGYKAKRDVQPRNGRPRRRRDNTYGDEAVVPSGTNEVAAVEEAPVQTEENAGVAQQTYSATGASAAVESSGY